MPLGPSVLLTRSPTAMAPTKADNLACSPRSSVASWAKIWVGFSACNLLGLLLFLLLVGLSACALVAYHGWPVEWSWRIKVLDGCGKMCVRRKIQVRGTLCSRILGIIDGEVRDGGWWPDGNLVEGEGRDMGATGAAHARLHRHRVCFPCAVKLPLYILHGLLVVIIAVHFIGVAHVWLVGGPVPLQSPLPRHQELC